MSRPDWFDDRGCADFDPAHFHELAWDEVNGKRHAGFHAIRAVCWVCPVRTECRSFAVDLVRREDISSPEGVFAGLDPFELRRAAGLRAPSLGAELKRGRRTVAYLVPEAETETWALVRPTGARVAVGLGSPSEVYEVVFEKSLEVPEP